MNVVLGSIFRNSSHYLHRYFSQAYRLREELKERGDSLRLVLVEGDSSDDTWEALAKWGRDFDLSRIKREHGGPPWGSVDDPARWRALSFCCNGVMEYITAGDDAVIYVESDLHWEVPTMIRLLDQLDDDHPAIAAMCFTALGAFYDTWGHRKNGKSFGPFPPYHAELKAHDLTEIDSAGSCIVMRGDVARRVRFGPEDCVRGLGRSIWENGYSLWIDPHARVVHP